MRAQVRICLPDKGNPLIPNGRRIEGPAPPLSPLAKPAWLVGLVVLVLVWLPEAGSGHDDVWIYIHSAEMLAKAGGFININGAHQLVVTSWLMTLLGAPLVHLLAQSGLWIWLGWKVLAFLIYLGGLALLLRHLAHEAGERAVLVVVLLLAAFPSVGAWAWGGLDSGLFLLGAVAFSLALGRLVQSGSGWSNWIIAWVAGAVFCFSRTDASWGFLLPLLIAVMPGNSAVRWRLLGLCIARLVTLTASMVVVWHWTGEPVPNPALVKAGFGWSSLSDGLNYWRQWFSQSPAHLASLLLWPVCMWIIIRRVMGKSADDVLLSIAAVALVMDLASVVTGGDWMSEFRFSTRTLELKLAAAGVMACQQEWFHRLQHGTAVAWTALLISLIVWASSASGIVVGQRGITAKPPGIRADWLGLLTRGPDSLVDWNEASRRDAEGIGSYMKTDVWRTRLGRARNEGRPIVFASYQAGYFPRLLRLESDNTAVFIDLAGLTDYRLAVPRDQPRTALGLHAGLIDWARSFRDRTGPVGAAGSCVPELVYVLGADRQQLGLMAEAGYTVEWRNASAVIFAAGSTLRRATWQDCRVLMT